MNIIKKIQDSGLNMIPAAVTKAPFSMRITAEQQKAHNITTDYTWKIFQYEKFTNNSEFENPKYPYKGIVCGSVSGGLECLDIDLKYDNTGKVYEKFCSLIPSELLSKMYIETTVNKGFHFIYYTEVSEGNKKLAKKKDQKVLFETRGEGGFVVSYPSQGYSIVQGDITNLPFISLDERDIIFSAARSFNYKWEAETIRTENNSQTSTFDDYNSQTKGIELLLSSGWKQQRVSNDEIYLTRPDKDKGVSGGFSSSRNLFYCFTTSSQFEAEKAYNPVQLYTILNHNGNYSESSKDLYHQGFGARYSNAPKFTEPETKTNVLDFPIHVFPPKLQNFIKVAARTNNYSIDFMSVAFMSALSTIMGNKVKIQVKNDWVTPAIFWFAAVGNPGSTKTHPLNFMLKPLKYIDKDSSEKYKNELTAFEVNEDAKKENKENMQRPKFHQTILNDATIESIFRAHAINENGLCFYKDELIGWFNSMGQYKSGNSSDQEFWLESFNNNSYTINRVNNDAIILDNININIIGSIQPSKLNKIPRDNGLAHRFLFTKTNDRIDYMTLDDIPAELIYEYNQKMVNYYYAVKSQPDEYIYVIPNDELMVFQKIDKYLVDKQRSGDVNQNMISYISKLKTAAPRLALLLLGADTCYGVNGGNYFGRAFELIRYFESTATNIFYESEKTKELVNVVSTMKGKTKTEIIVELINKGIKGKDIAEQVGVSKGYISKIKSTMK